MDVPLACGESDCEDGSGNSLVNTPSKNSENKQKKPAKMLTKGVFNLFLAFFGLLLVFFEGVLTKLYPNPHSQSVSIEAKETYNLSSPDKICFMNLFFFMKKIIMGSNN